jgi:asparagine synthase (glutamine-hydrolysing)
MCGITGFINIKSHMSKDMMLNISKKMTDSLYHRGPDQEGIWVDEQIGIALGHRRLSILDLSQEGSQPMISSSTRYCIVYNGEIYNFSILRNELIHSGFSFRGHSDTEVLLAAIECWGLDKSIQRFTGMFAFALFDRHERCLYLVRDRLGEKPLYYGSVGSTFIFGSELKAICAHPDFIKEINRDAVALYLRYNCVPSPYSIYKGIYKLSAGSMVKVNIDNPTFDLSPIQYWSVKAIAEERTIRPFAGSESEAVHTLDSLLREAVKQQMVADVPIGAFLSGGIDSSTIVSLMQTQSKSSVKTFTIGFSENGYNEAEYAKQVAKHLGTDHTELYITPQQALDVIPKIPSIYDEPFSDSSQIPTYLVSQLARQHVTVSLSGDGGDELFGGYKRYMWTQKIWGNMKWVPGKSRRLLSFIATSVSPQNVDKLFNVITGFLPAKYKNYPYGDKLHKLAELLAVQGPEDIYYRLVSHWNNPLQVVLGAEEPSTVFTDRNLWMNTNDFTKQMMYLDMMSYLPDDILTKVDRASMAVSLESRIPMLDHRVVEFASSLPQSMKIKSGVGKWILRQVLYQYVPKQLVERPKMGFGVPIDSWLRGPLREWAESLLEINRLKAEGFFNPEPIRIKWTEHLSGKRNWQYHLWDILMFQAWLEDQK